MSSIFASFMDPEHGKKAAGALLDHGVLKDDISLVVRERFASDNPHYWLTTEEYKSTSVARGVTTTTPSDARVGAVEGGAFGLVVGVLGALVCLTIPGFGLVIGGGALATAIGAAVGTTAAGALAGGVTGYLKDQGVPDANAAHYDATLNRGGALLSVEVPSGQVTAADVESILSKYGANRTDLTRYHATPVG